MSQPLRIAVIGAGNVGVTLAAAWSRAGHDVSLGVRHPEGPENVSAAASAGCDADTVGAAMGRADIVVTAIPGHAMAGLIRGEAADLAGKIVVDATNDLTGGHAAGTMSALGHLADDVPTASGYRAFNSVGWEVMAEPVVAGQTADLCYAGPDVAARAEVERLIDDVGFRPVYLGSGDDAHRAVDALATLWFALAFGRGHGRRLAMRILTDHASDGTTRADKAAP